MTWFNNKYRHCGDEWESEWSCACNDECPVCGAEIEPYESDDLSVVVEPMNYVVHVSPQTAEDGPDYTTFRFFTEAEARSFAERKREELG